MRDLKAVRIRGILRRLAAAGLVTLADKGYVGAGEHVRVPVQREEQARLAEGRELRPRQAARPRRARQCATEDLAYPPRAPLLPTSRRPSRRFSYYSFSRPLKRASRRR
ncbi:hypothetical protein [Nonomuraea sp. NPDC003754]